MNIHYLILGVALILALFAIIKPAPWVCPVAVILLAIELFSRVSKSIVIISVLALGLATVQAQTIIVTNAIPDNPLAAPVTVSNLVTSVPKGVTQVATDGYNVFKNFSPTNPLSIGLFGLQNGSGKYGIGLEANTVRSDSPVSAGFALAAIQTETKDANGKVKNSFGFYDATVNLSVSQVENIPILNLPLTLRIFSGPFASLGGGVLIGEQSGLSGDLAFGVTKSTSVDLGGGVVNCAGAAAADLKPVMPMAHFNVVLSSWKFWK